MVLELEQAALEKAARASLGTARYRECKFLGPAPNVLNQKLWDGVSISCFNKCLSVTLKLVKTQIAGASNIYAQVSGTKNLEDAQTQKC